VRIRRDHGWGSWNRGRSGSRRYRSIPASWCAHSAAMRNRPNV